MQLLIIKNMKRKILIGLILVTVIGIIIAVSMYFKPHQSMIRLSPEFMMTSDELLMTFETDEIAANEKLVDKVIEVSGIIGTVQTDNDGITVIISTDNPVSGIICEMDDLSSHKMEDLAEGETVKLKCLCTGYLMDVSMRRCIVVK